MIKITGQCKNKKDHDERCHDIGFQFAVWRHQQKLRLNDIANRTGYSVEELDEFELGGAAFDVFICLYHYYNQMPELYGNLWEAEIEK